MLAYLQHTCRMSDDVPEADNFPGYWQFFNPEKPYY